MRFEIFDGPTSVALADWERPGQIRLHVRDRALLGDLAEHFGGRPGDAEEDGVLLIARPDWSPAEFEQACVALRASGRFVVVARQMPDPGSHRRSRT